jgi:hypothetical protein
MRARAEAPELITCMNRQPAQALARGGEDGVGKRYVQYPLAQGAAANGETRDSGVQLDSRTRRLGWVARRAVACSAYCIRRSSHPQGVGYA